VGGLAATNRVLKVYEALQHPVPSADRVAHTAVDVWHSEVDWEGADDVLALLGVLLHTATGRAGLRDEVRHVARGLLPTVAACACAPEPGTPVFGSLAEAVVCLEAVRTTALLVEDPALRPALSWRSAWDPPLWVCDW
jgi:hypothetical protein